MAVAERIAVPPLTKAALKALEDEARREMEHAISERFAFLGEPHGDKQEKVLLACADVLGAVGRSRLDFHDFDHRPEADHPETVTPRFTEAAFQWMGGKAVELGDYLAEMDTNSSEGDYEEVAKSAYLRRVLDRILGTEGLA